MINATKEQDSVTLQGLSSTEVAKRVADGRVNTNTDVKTKSIPAIIKDNALTLFNVVNIAMACLVLLTGELRNVLFMAVVFANLLIGIVQEVRAKLMVDRLSLLAAQNVTVIRDGHDKAIAPSELVVDDLIRLRTGDQIPADCTLVEGLPTVNESLLTGESKPVEKKQGDELLSGSFIDSGSLVACTSRVGQDGYAARINAEAKYVKPINSEIMQTVNSIIRTGSIALIPLGIGLFLRTYLHAPNDVSAAILSSVAAVIGMIPQGLVLLTSSVLAIATARLAFKKVLIQQTYCIETLARIDTLCLDKTGTITTGNMEVAHIVDADLNPQSDVSHVIEALAAITDANRHDANDTAQAILTYLAARDVRPPRISRAIPFTSARKYSGCITDDGICYVMGAAQFVMNPEIARRSLASGIFDELERVLVVCRVEGISEDNAIIGTPQLLGFVGIQDQIRQTAPETIQYFIQQGVDLRVISGDDPRTVAAIAQRACIPHADAWVDATTLKDEKDIAHAVATAHVFGRVTPQQKRLLVQALQAEGHTVAMTGDGVNDILALRESDCSISMASGSAAARNVSEIVLVDNDFAHMPEVVAEGRRSINNLQRSASLFLVKTVFTAALALFCIIMPPYPFIPIQMSLLSFATVGFPSFVLALEVNHDRVQGNFLKNVLKRSLPASAAITVSLALAIVCGRLMGVSRAEVSTVCLMVTGVIGVLLIYRISLPLNTLRRTLLAAVSLMVILGCTVFRSFFRIVWLMPNMYGLLALALLVALCVFNWLYTFLQDHGNQSRIFAVFVRVFGGKNNMHTPSDA